MITPETDLAAHWWFLTPHGYKQWVERPAAQGYEVLSRHSLFPTLKTHPGNGAIVWEHGSATTKPTWAELTPNLQAAFLFDYKFDLRRMGLHELAWVGPKRVTFDCTEGWPSVAQAVRFQLQLAVTAGRVRINPTGYRRTIPSGALKFLVRTRTGGNRDMVTIEWGDLTKTACGVSIDNLLGALGTFWEQDVEFIKYRADRHLALGKRDSLRPKISNPANLALACAIWDCQHSGVGFQDNLTTVHLKAVGMDKLSCSDAKNHVRRLKQMQALAGLRPPPRHAKPRAKGRLSEPIDVALILETGTFSPSKN